ncbi:MAG: multi-sensor signal transduction histidine kinase [Cyanobacteria bacterium RYN_339]|nr:multi-sensor signal transduction histidine kinase [Cyanobacteria bacterium RYN_339]
MGHVLVVDDTQDNRALLVRLLEDDYRITQAANGQEALAAIAADRPDLVMLDLAMPVLDGFKVLERLKAERGPFLPVIVITAAAERADRLRALALDACEFLTKPIDAEEVLARTRNLIELKVVKDVLVRQNEQLESQVAARTAELSLALADARAQAVALRASQSHLALRARHVMLRAEVGEALGGLQAVNELLQTVCETIVRHLDASLVQVWLGAEAGQVLALRASAGPARAPEELGARVAVVAGEGGLLACSGLADPDPIGDAAWRREEGLVDFAGYPLVVEGRGVGVMRMWSRSPLSAEVRAAFAAIADAVALGVDHKQVTEALRNADIYKDEFLAVISHELRTPLNFITGFASVMEDEVSGPLNPVQRVQIGKILQGADRMLLLVEDLLDIASIQAGKTELQRELTPYGPLVSETMAALSRMAEARGVTLETAVDVAHPIPLDGPRVVQIITNLVGNALKFTPAGGKVCVRAFVAGSELVTEVEDTGCGIPGADLERVFQKFQQVDMSSTRIVGGTGLGLAISKALVEAHGGRIDVTSELGAGTTFRFLLPLT